VLRDFPRARVIQLPQSIRFRRQRRVERMRTLCEGHSDLTLMVRDRPSQRFAREQLGVEATLCPDMALALEPLQRPREPLTDIVWLARTDAESRLRRPPSQDGVERSDWRRLPPGEPPRGLRARHAATRGAYERVGGWAQARGTAARALWRPLALLHPVLAAQRVAIGARVLARGRVVVTDRLHGHVLALLLGIPNVLVDNRTGKNRDLYETWTAPHRDTRWAATPEEALALARAIAGA
jgi:pyruvyl transferase EpsO